MTTNRESANRANAAKSTGPKTQEGKSQSSQNAVTHGLTSRSPLLPGEDPEELRRLEKDLASHYADTPMTRSWIAQAAACQWRLARVPRLEAAMLMISSAARRAFGLVPANGRTPTLEELATGCGIDAGTTYYELSQDLIRVIPNLALFNRYERGLLDQLIRLLQLLEPHKKNRESGRRPKSDPAADDNGEQNDVTATP